MLQPQHYPVALLVLAAWSSHAATTSAPGPASSSVFVAECAPETVANTVGVDVSMTYGYVESTAAVAFTVQFPAPVVAWAGLGIREGSLNGMVGLDIAVFDSVTAFVQDCHPLGLSTRPPVDTIQNTNLISHDSAGGFVTVSWWRYVFTGDIAGDNNITDTFNMGIATGIGTVSDNTYQKHTSAQIVVVSHVCNPPPTSAPDTVAPTSLAPSTSAPSQAPPTTGPSQAPSTTAPSQAPETTAPSQAPPTTAPSQSPETTAPTTAPSQTPETTAPSQAPATAAPSQAPATTAPSQTPETTAPSQAPETTAPSQAPETSAPSQAPETTAPSQA
ncbi:beta-fructofuranosidase-like protein, partial [Diplonema papillatum]